MARRSYVCKNRCPNFFRVSFLITLFLGQVKQAKDPTPSPPPQITTVRHARAPSVRVDNPSPKVGFLRNTNPTVICAGAISVR